MSESASNNESPNLHPVFLRHRWDDAVQAQILDKLSVNLCEQVGSGREVRRPHYLLLLFGKVSREGRDAIREHPDAPVCHLDVGDSS